MKIIVVSAFRQEIQEFISRDSLQRVTTSPFPLYSGDDYSIVISGPGKVNAASAVTNLLGDYGPCYVINAGTAGSLKPEIAEGTVLEVTGILEPDRPLFNGEKRFMKLNKTVSGLESTVCMCRDMPVISVQERALFSDDADIADMESAAVFQVCRIFRAECTIIKSVSDGIGCNDRDEIMLKIGLLSKKLYEPLRSFINLLKRDL